MRAGVNCSSKKETKNPRLGRPPAHTASSARRFRSNQPVIWSLTDHTMAWPGGVRARRGMRPFQSAAMPAGEGHQKAG